jgi:hypothetical protein
MNRMIDPRKVQQALDRAAKSSDRTGRFTLKARMMPLVESSKNKDELLNKQIRDRPSVSKRSPD